MKHRLLAVAALAGAVLTAAPAFAYTTYLLPQDFWPSTDSVTIDGASTQAFFQPGVGINNLSVTNPDGSSGSITGTEVDADHTTIHVLLTTPGTYEVSTGEQKGQVANIWDLGSDQRGDPRIQARRDGDAAPAGATPGTFQSVQLSQTYVTYGQTSRGVVDGHQGTLTIHPITDPNQIVQATGFQVEVLFNGAPLPNFSVVVYGDGDADTKLDHYVNTDASGRATLTFTQPGHYTAAVRKLARAPAGGEATVQLFTTTLTFDVMAAEHPPVTVAPPPAAQDQQTHRRPPPASHRAGRQDR
ncbi:MAG: DUF4198 domain-containing protein [Terricaulis sp.]